MAKKIDCRGCLKDEASLCRNGVSALGLAVCPPPRVQVQAAGCVTPLSGEHSRYNQKRQDAAIEASKGVIWYTSPHNHTPYRLACRRLAVPCLPTPLKGVGQIGHVETHLHKFFRRQHPLGREHPNPADSDTVATTEVHTRAADGHQVSDQRLLAGPSSLLHPV